MIVPINARWFATLNRKIGFIGNGMMTEAIVGGLLNTKTSTKEEITSSNPNPPRRIYMNEKFGIMTFADNLEVVRRNKIILLSVKPWQMEEVIVEIRDHL